MKVCKSQKDQLAKKKLSISPFTSTQKSLKSESSVLIAYTSEHDVAASMTSFSLLRSEWIFIPEFGKSFISSSYQLVWFAGSEMSHCSLIGQPASTDLFPSASGTAENQTGAIAISSH